MPDYSRVQEEYEFDAPLENLRFMQSLVDESRIKRIKQAIEGGKELEPISLLIISGIPIVKQGTHRCYFSRITDKKTIRAKCIENCGKNDNLLDYYTSGIKVTVYDLTQVSPEEFIRDFYTKGTTIRGLLKK